MTTDDTLTRRHFVTYSGIKLPLKLVTPLDEADLNNRNTFFRGTFDANDRLVLCEKVVYGTVEMSHAYTYHADTPTVARAEITGADGDVRVVTFDAEGRPVASGEDD